MRHDVHEEAQRNALRAGIARVGRRRAYVLADVAVGNRCAPLAGIRRVEVLELLVADDGAPGRVVVIGAEIVAIVALQCDVLREVVRSLCRPGVHVVVACAIAEHLREDAAIEVMVRRAIVELASPALETDGLIVGCRICLAILVEAVEVVLVAAVEVEATGVQRCREGFLAELCLYARELRIEHDIHINADWQAAEAVRRIAVLALCPEALETEAARRVLRQVAVRIEARSDFPVVIDLCLRLQAERVAVRVVARLDVALIAPLAAVDVDIHWCLIVTDTAVVIAQHAVPLHVVSILLELGDTHTEVVQLIGELCRELLDQRLVGCRDVLLGHGLGDHLRHLIARDLLTALEGRITIALNDAILGQRRHGVVCPMVRWHIRKRIGRGKRGAGCTDEHGCRQRRYDRSFHDTYPILSY